MNEIKEVHTYETEDRSSMTAIFLIIAALVIGVGFLVWQPWNTGVRTDTTIIRDGGGPDTTIVNPPANNTVINPPSTTIVNPPAQNDAPDVNITNEAPAPAPTPTEPPVSGGG